jgi:hypothetical protein
MHAIRMGGSWERPALGTHKPEQESAMTIREDYIAELKVRLERCNAAIGRSSVAGGKQLAALRERREQVLTKLRSLAPGDRRA